MNHSTLEPLSYSVPLKNYNDFPEEWMGQRSHRFTRTIRFDPPKDLIKTSIFSIIQISIFPTKRQKEEDLTLTNHPVSKNLSNLLCIKFPQ
jgi:hypothetical protein